MNLRSCLVILSKNVYFIYLLNFVFDSISQTTQKLSYEKALLVYGLHTIARNKAVTVEISKELVAHVAHLAFDPQFCSLWFFVRFGLQKRRKQSLLSCKPICRLNHSVKTSGSGRRRAHLVFGTPIVLIGWCSPFKVEIVSNKP